MRGFDILEQKCTKEELSARVLYSSTLVDAAGSQAECVLGHDFRQISETRLSTYFRVRVYLPVVRSLVMGHVKLAGLV